MIVEANSSEEVLQILESQKINLLITILKDPDTGGTELASFLREEKVFRNLNTLIIREGSTENKTESIQSTGVAKQRMLRVFDFYCRIFGLMKKSSGTRDFARIAGIKWSEFREKTAMIGKVNKLVSDRMDDPHLRVADLADLLNTSERNVHRIIRSLVNHTPKAYIRKIRLDYAEELLKSKRFGSVAEVSKAVGMINSDSFSRQFEKQKGIRPGDLLRS